MEEFLPRRLFGTCPLTYTAPELTTKLEVKAKVRDRDRVRVRIRVKFRVRVNNNNLGAAELTDKYRLFP